MAEIEKGTEEKTTITLNKNDAALVISVDGEFHMVIPDAREDEMVAGNALLVAAIGTLICKQGQPFIDEIIERFEKVQDEESNGATLQ